jgi:succinyl-CoA synthetase beta subunit
MLFAAHGGVEIEQVAAARPEAMRRVYVHPLEGFRPHHARELLRFLPDAALRDRVAAIVPELHRCLVESDATLCEINPLVIDALGRAIALDAKVTLDDSALHRHPEFVSLSQPRRGTALEELAAERGVAYVKLDGTVGILGNGAGLAMATVDVVAFAGGSPANFCDLGGGGSAAGVVASLGVIASDPQVRSILFNIFGGITRCDEVARGILAALDMLDTPLPIVVRLDGTNAEEGRAILEQAAPSGIFVETTMLAAAHRAVELAA